MKHRLRRYLPSIGDCSKADKTRKSAFARGCTGERIMRAGEYLGLYGRLRENVPGVTSHIVQFIGAERGAGTSAIAREFAQTIASMAARNVLLIRDGQVSSDIECGRQEVSTDPPAQVERNALTLVRNVESANGSALAQIEGAGPPLSRMASHQVDTFLRTLRTEYDLIVIDSPPLNDSSEGLPIACKLDGVILVIRAGRTNADLAEAAKRSIEGVGAKLLGVALNTRFA